MHDLLRPVPPIYRGLWERTRLERRSAGTLTSDRPARVFWLQTPVWHADLRVPLERPEFGDVASIEACSDDQLAFLAGQEGFCGVTRIDGLVATWLRVVDLSPGTALDIGRMRFETDDLLVETGIAEDYLEDWTRVAGSVPERGVPPLGRDASGCVLLTSGGWRMRIGPRPRAPESFDPYCPADERDRADLLWVAALELTLLRRTDEGWIAELSTHPWVEGTVDEDEDPMPASEAELLAAGALMR